MGQILIATLVVFVILWARIVYLGTRIPMESRAPVLGDWITVEKANYTFICGEKGQVVSCNSEVVRLEKVSYRGLSRVVMLRKWKVIYRLKNNGKLYKW